MQINFDYCKDHINKEADQTKGGLKLEDLLQELFEWHEQELYQYLDSCLKSADKEKIAEAQRLYKRAFYGQKNDNHALRQRYFNLISKLVAGHEVEAIYAEITELRAKLKLSSAPPAPLGSSGQ